MNRCMLIHISIIYILLGIPKVCWGSDFQKGVEAANRGDYVTAIKEWTLPAKQGDADAQYALGAMYYAGYGVPQDYQAAVKWYTLAAEQGNALAQFNLGVMHKKGHGVSKDHVRAHMWFNLSASTGHQKAAKFRDVISDILTDANLSAARKLARDCVAKNYKGC